MKQTLVVYNLTAGLRRRSRLLKIIKKKLPRAHFELVFMNFENFLTAEDLAAKWGYDLVVVAGGDGTIRRVSSFLLSHKLETPIAIVPIGSANILAQSLRIPLRVTQALRLIAHGQPQTIDVGCINQKYYFLEAFAMGYISERIIDAGRTLKSFVGFGGYLLSFLFSRKINQYFFEFTVEDAHYKRLGSSLMIVNTQRLFGFEPKRQNDLRDGLFELTLVTSKTFKEFIEATYQYFFHGRPSKYMLLTEGKKFIIHNRPHTRLQIDGDPIEIESGSITIEILTKKISFICVPIHS